MSDTPAIDPLCSDADEDHPDQPLELAIVKDPDAIAAVHAERLAARLRNRARHLRRFPTKRGITCYRLYERDVPEIPLVIDRYEDHLHVGEFERIATRQLHQSDPAGHARWLQTLVRTAADVLQVPRDHVFVKQRYRQRGLSQHEAFDNRRYLIHANEGGLKFIVNLSDYVDAGLFLDHRITRSMFRDVAGGKRVLNLFAYTGSFSVYAAHGGAASTTTVDLSSTYLDWAAANLSLNGLSGPQHVTIRSGVMEYLRSLPTEPLFDLAIVDPPTFSNSKRTGDDWQVQRDHVTLINQTLQRMSAGGVIFFSNNFRGFKLDTAAIAATVIHEISRQTVPEDFRNTRIHRCWRIVK